MNRNEYLAALRGALSGLPDEERANALRYYEEYFDEAGPAGEEQAARDLGAPETVAAQILADYRELTAAPRSDGSSQSGQAGAGAAQASPKRTWRGINPWLLLVIAIFAIPVGVPVAAAVFGVLLAVLGVIFAVVVTVVALAACVPLVLLALGAGFIICSFFIWWTPASALVTLGAGFACLSLGILAAMLVVKLCALFLPPVFRGFVAILRWPIDKIRGVKK